MSNEVKRQYLEGVRIRYLKCTKKQKTLILDEFSARFAKLAVNTLLS